jgi:hypothetical protein
MEQAEDLTINLKKKYILHMLLDYAVKTYTTTQSTSTKQSSPIYRPGVAQRVPGS